MMEILKVVTQSYSLIVMVCRPLNDFQLHDGCELLGEGVGDTCVTLATVGWDLFIAIVDANTAEDICSAFLECKK